MLDTPKGCRFAPRCTECMKVCVEQEPPAVCINANGHISSCWQHIRQMKEEVGNR